MILLKSLSLGLQLLIVGIMLRALRSPYQFPRWTGAWCGMLVAALLMSGRRIYDFWLPVSLWSVLLPIGVSLSLCVGLYFLTSIFLQAITVLQATEPALVEIDQTSTICAWNPQAERLFGWPAGEVLGRTILQTIIPPRDWEAHRQGLARLLTTGDEGRVIARTFAVNARRKQDDEIAVTIRITSVPQADGTLHFLGSIRELGTL